MLDRLGWSWYPSLEAAEVSSVSSSEDMAG